MERIYVVESDEEITLVKAKSQTQAMNHVVQSSYKVRVASAMDVLDYINAGGVVGRYGELSEDEVVVVEGEVLDAEESEDEE